MIFSPDHAARLHLFARPLAPPPPSRNARLSRALHCLRNAIPHGKPAHGELPVV